MSDFSLVIGVGNRARRDDGAGPAVLDALAAQDAAVARIEIAGDCARLIDLWEGQKNVHVIDATQGNGAPGTILRLDAIAAPVPRGTFLHTSHAFGVAEAVETARALGQLPETLRLWGIEGADFSYGDGLSDAVARAVPSVAAEIADAVPGSDG